MLIDVEDPIRNLVPNGCFYSIVVLSLVALIPWSHLGAVRISQALRWLVVPVLARCIEDVSFIVRGQIVSRYLFK